MRFHEIQDDDRIAKLNEFVAYVLDRLDITNPPKIEFINDRQHALKLGSFGGFSLDDHSIRVNIAGRHVADVMRTLAHEIVHYRQNGEKEGGLTAQDGATGTDYENEANALAGQIMRDYARRNPKIFESRR
jgi:hypothetical protein